VPAVLLVTKSDKHDVKFSPEMSETVEKGDILLYEQNSVAQSSSMPRTSRASQGGFVYHVLNRGHGRCNVFHEGDDIAAFVNLMREAHEKVPMRPAGFCLMTNHSTCLRVNMVQLSQDWEWSSLKPTTRSGPDGLLCDGPVLKPAQWTRLVNGEETEVELKVLRRSLARRQ